MATSSLMFPSEASGLEWNPQAVGARNAMTDFYTTLLNEVKKTDPSAQLSTIGGMAHIVTGGKSFPITATHKADADNYGITPDQWVSSNIMGQPLTLTADQRAKVQAQQLAALQGSAGPDTVGGQQVQQQIDSLKAFWQTPAGQGQSGIAPVNATENRTMYPDQGALGTSPFGGYSVTPPAPPAVAPPVNKLVETPPIVRATPPPITRLATVPLPAGAPYTGNSNALAPQVNQPIQQGNQNYQQNLDRFRQNRWGRGGR